MKDITKIIISSALLLASLWAAADNSRPGRLPERDERRYPRRRYYTSRINVFEDAPKEELKIEEPKAPAAQNAPAGSTVDMSRSNVTIDPRAVRPAPPRIRGNGEDDKDDKNWILNALLKKDAEDAEEGSEDDQELQTDWGWLASQMQEFSERDAEGRELSQQERLELLLSGSDEDIRTELLSALESARLEMSEGAQTNQASVSEAGRQVLLDFDKMAEQRFDIFRPVEKDPVASAEERKSKNDTAEDEKKDLESNINEDIAAGMRFREDSFPANRPNDLAGLGRSERELAQAKPEFRAEERRFSSQLRDDFDFSESPGKLQSAFDADMSSKFKSPFERDSSAGGVGAASRQSYRPADYAKPLAPIGGGIAGGAGFSRDDDFGYNPNRGSFGDPLSDNRKRPPSSIHQWD
jgi:hypothetical protein